MRQHTKYTVEKPSTRHKAFVRSNQAPERTRQNSLSTTAGHRLAGFWRGRWACVISAASGEQNFGGWGWGGCFLSFLFKLICDLVCHLNIRKNFFTVRVMEHRNRLPREVVGSPGNLFTPVDCGMISILKHFEDENFTCGRLPAVPWVSGVVQSGMALAVSHLSVSMWIL